LGVLLHRGSVSNSINFFLAKSYTRFKSIMAPLRLFNLFFSFTILLSLFSLVSGLAAEDEAVYMPHQIQAMERALQRPQILKRQVRQS